MDRVLFMISHPAHFHMFKNVIKLLRQAGKEITIIIRPKDVLEKICDFEGLDYTRIKERPRKSNIFKLGFSLIGRTRAVHRIIHKTKPQILLGSDGVLAYAGLINRIPSVEFFEDDARQVKLYAFLFFPFYTHLISPKVNDAWLWNKKKISYEGFQKLTYLHPHYFQPDFNIKERYIKGEKYFLIRISALNAHHDINAKGFSNENIRDLIKLLTKYGEVYISSEKTLPPDLLKYKLEIDPSEIHHILAFATIFIGDSQSMSVEASILGVPSVRLSSFAGKLSVLEELEHKYGLTYGFLPSDHELMFNKVRELLALPDLRSLWNEKREKMLTDKIDVTAFMVWFIENYPESRNIMKRNPDYQYRFK